MSSVDLSSSLFVRYKRARKRADEAMKRGDLAASVVAYRQSADLMRQYAETTKSRQVRKQRLERAETLEHLANRLMDTPAAPQFIEHRGAGQPAEPTGEDDYEAEALNLLQRTQVRWDDIGGLDDTKNVIKSAYGLALARKPKGIKLNSWRNILFFGPPGTGKTLLAAATAGSLDANFFNVKVSNLLSKYFGESPKLISSLYATARRLHPSVVFLDEFESLTPPRGSGESGAERRIVSTFLAELDGLESMEDERLVLTIGATNLPWLIDSAVLSRFQKRIYIPLPDAAAREAIIQIHIQRNGLTTDLAMDELVRRTDGYSGREIEQLVQAATNRMVGRVNPVLTQIVDQGRQAVEDYVIQVGAIARSDFESAFEQHKAGTDPALLEKYEEWLKGVEA